MKLTKSDISPAVEARFWSHVDQSGGPDACWPWIGSRDRRGYGLFGIGKGPWRGRVARSNRVAFALANGEMPDGLSACHCCDNPPCCNPNHLFSGTSSDNVHDMVKKGRSLRGSRNLEAKLTEEAVVEIKMALAAGEHHSAIAKRYGVSRPAISYISRGIAWRHVAPPDSYARQP